LSNGRAVAFEREWLVRALAQAAQRAGLRQVVARRACGGERDVLLRDQAEITVLPVERLTKAVRSVLQVIGYSEVGSTLRAWLAAARVSLVELAREAGTGYELAFFERLGRRSHELVAEKSARFDLVDLEPCRETLSARKVWCRDCDALREEIVSFTREQMGIAAAEHEVTFSLA
jgi:hypothetical protein